MQWWLRRFGILRRATERTLWILADEPESYEASRSLLAELRRQYPRRPLCLTSRRTATLRWLRARYPEDTVLPTPFPLRLCIRRFIRNVKPNALIVLGAADAAPAAVFERLERRAIGIALIDGWFTEALRTHADRFDCLVMRTPEDAKLLLEADVPAARVVHGGCLTDGIAAVQRTLDGVRPVIMRDLKTARDALRPNPWGRRRRLAESDVGRWLLARSGERIAGFETLRERLGGPEVLLCLGNGPSSEDPRLREIAFDALFRVNWCWVDRGYLTRPDVVFTADPETIRRVEAHAFAFRTIGEEIRIFRRRLLRPQLAPIRYLTYERTSGVLNGRDWGAIPTNGAVMLATAVALRPRRIVLAGIDLFAHPDGSYPGSSDVPNAYAPVHDRDVEVAIIRHLLEGFEGEAEIIGEPLQAAMGWA